ncbi:hypothetical protein [Clostridium gasigenes]|uniref:Uncharacterized protein n=1 Tax=Clostridium gasigenes TaxID=94869 RepID=A0A1H0LNN0_9CLOT|nr:hypothetical protein [Clostridium gasigenes]MBB6713941.1 hypothetical protein [Clostridium gasigenes]MBU3087212.1 hypothetical protein [Clostridium gasigenes]SDO69767.1 hypothetical protein SAMN04488529_101147 [Clostridium gasigenes]
MLENYTLMYKDIEVGIISYNNKLDKFSFQLNKEIKNIKYLPPILYDYTNLSLDYKPCNENILWWIEDRVMPPDRDAVDHILNIMELPFYDAWEICKANKGMSLEDYWWLKSNNEIYEECHIRYLIESGKQTVFGIPV